MENRSNKNDFTQGSIPKKLTGFMLPVLAALVLQAMYGAVDMLVVGRFGSDEAISAVSTGSNIINMFTFMIAGLTMGMTVIIGKYIGERRSPEKIGRTIGSAIALFLLLTAVLMVIVVLGAPLLTTVMQAPESAYKYTVQYVQICGAGLVFIFAYNILSGIFRGIGNSSLPLLFVAIACTVNIIGDLVFVAAFDMNVTGAALATVLAQAVSVILSFVIIRKKELPFTLSFKDIRFSKETVKVLKTGTPIALQDVLSNISFLVICALINGLGLAASSGYGIAQKVISFIMLIPSSLMQSMSAFIAQNVGAKKFRRAKHAMYYGMGMGAAIGIFITAFIFFHGDIPSSVFSNNKEYITEAANYLKGFAIDPIITCILFSFIGYFSGNGRTVFVMIQGIACAFLVRVPVSIIMSIQPTPSLLNIGAAVPASTVVGIVICVLYFSHIEKKNKQEASTV